MKTLNDILTSALQSSWRAKKASRGFDTTRGSWNIGDQKTPIYTRADNVPIIHTLSTPTNPTRLCVANGGFEGVAKDPSISPQGVVAVVSETLLRAREKSGSPVLWSPAHILGTTERTCGAYLLDVGPEGPPFSGIEFDGPGLIPARGEVQHSSGLGAYMPNYQSPTRAALSAAVENVPGELGGNSPGVMPTSATRGSRALCGEQSLSE